MLAKFRNLAGEVVGKERSKKIQEAVFGLEEMGTVEELIRLLK
jgi:hypothetical protein